MLGDNAFRALCGLVISFFVLTPASSQAQRLEEIVVTAQRRTQSLQDVPISIDVVSGDVIDKQGFTFLRDLADFTPGIIIKNRFEEQGMMIRGSGTTGKNKSTEQAAPIFVDGVYFGMASQTMNAFLDSERVEILKGPQPVYFGQSATAGAISITSKKPGPEWEGRAVLEYANNNTQRIEFGVGGPITDTLGIRVAAKLKQSDGFMEDIFTGERFPFVQEKGIRGILQWRPIENLEATFKLEFSEQDMGSRAASIACGKNPLDTTHGMSVLITGLEGYDFDPVDCSELGNFTERGYKSGPLYIAPTPEITNANTSPRGIVDMTQLGPGDLGPEDDPFYRGLPPKEFLNGDFTEDYSSKPWNGLLNLAYTLGNGIEFTSLTGFNRQVFQTIRNPTGPFLTDARRNYIDYNSWSQEFRVTSLTGGTFEWMMGAYLQVTEIDINAESWRAEPQTAFRSSSNGEDDEYKSLFATFTYNFLDGKASLDIGGRLSDVHKEAFADVYQAEWIVEDPVTGDPIVVPRVNIIPLGLHGAVAIGRTPFYMIRRNEGLIDDTKFNPQVVFRYRPGENVSLYAKWATGFKAGAFEMGQAQPPGGDAYQFDAENAEIWEVGARGVFLGGRANANLTLFWQNYEGLQVTSVQTVNNITSGRTSNAAKQRSRGAELAGRFLLSDRTSLGYSVMYLDSKMLDYTTATCNGSEQDLGLCGPNNTIDRSGEVSIQAPDWQASLQLDHWIPVFDRHKISFNANVIASDDYVTDRNWSRVTTMHDSQDLNLSVGYGDVDDVWQVSLWARNIMERRVTYNPEFDLTGDGLLQEPMNSSNFMSYGLQLKYSYQ